MRQPLDDAQVDVELRAGGDDVLGSLAPRLDGACRTTGRARSLGGTGAYFARSIPGGTTSASGTQRIASYEPTTSAPARFPYASCSGVLPRMSEPR